MWYSKVLANQSNSVVTQQVCDMAVQHVQKAGDPRSTSATAHRQPHRLQEGTVVSVSVSAEFVT